MVVGGGGGGRGSYTKVQKADSKFKNDNVSEANELRTTYGHIFMTKHFYYNIWTLTSTIRLYIMIINHQQIRNQPQTISAQHNTDHIRTNNEKHYRNSKHKEE
jgi:hypothetical protein